MVTGKAEGAYFPLTRQRLAAMKRFGRLDGLGPEERLFASIFASSKHKKVLVMHFHRAKSSVVLTSQGVRRDWQNDLQLVRLMNRGRFVREFGYWGEQETSLNAELFGMLKELAKVYIPPSR